jgi:hypothetical protein
LTIQRHHHLADGALLAHLLQGAADLLEWNRFQIRKE